MLRKFISLIVMLFMFVNSYAAQHTISTVGMTFAPANLSINLGDTVHFVNTGGIHNVNGTQATYPNNPASFGNSIGAGWTYTYVFDTLGIYDYRCDPHFPGMEGTITVNYPTIYDIVSLSTDHTTLETAVDACGLDVALSSSGSKTLFAPTDAAFSLLPAGTVTALLADIPQLTDILLYHVVGDSVMSNTLTNGQIVTTLNGADVTVTINSTGVYINNAQVTVTDILASNGVVHVIDAVLLPTIYDVVSTSNDHTTLKVAIDTCGLDVALSSSGSKTLFAPTDAAFNLLPAGTVTALLADIPQLTDILLYHVVGDSVMSNTLTNGQIVTTLNGADVTVTINSTGVYINNAQVTVTDILASNGVVHVIDAVLLPTIYDVVAASNDHTTLKVAIDACGLDVALSSSGSKTLFAPTDAAFNLLPAGTVTALLADIPQLTDILLYHVVGDSVMSNTLTNGQIVTTLNGADVTVTINSTGVYINNAQVTVTDILASNGIVHVIDAVLLPTIYDVVSTSNDHTTLKVAIDTCGLDVALSSSGSKTLFAPTDAAFNLLPSGQGTALLADIPQLTDILLYHVVGDSVMSNTLTNGQIVTTLNGADVTVTINSTGVYINNAQVTVTDILASNGVVHVIDAVLLPTIYDVVSTSNDHTTLKVAIDTCGLDVALSSSGSKTLFAPTDAAFNLFLSL